MLKAADMTYSCMALSLPAGKRTVAQVRSELDVQSIHNKEDNV